ncbi:MAG TPA: diguanylate cyclase, partial [Marinagarivorans sp.]|nr:diguanylate cyclase [Marinagarivorans sp.]
PGALAQALPQVAYLPDDGFSLDTIALTPTERWQPLAAGHLSLGFNPRPHWLRIQLKASPTAAFLQLAYPHLDYVRLYQVHNGQLVKQVSTGDMLPFAMRPLAHRYFVFPIAASSDPQTLYLWVQTSGLLQVPLKLVSREELAQGDQLYLLTQGLYYGFFLAASLFAFFLCLAHRDTTYGLFSLLVLAYAGVEALYSGLGYGYLWPNLPALNQMTMPICLSFAVAMAARFSLRVFRLQAGQRGYGAGQGLFWGALLLMALTPLLPVARALQACLLLIGLHCCLQTGLGLYWLRRKQAGGGWYCASWAIFSLGTLAAALNYWGLLADGTSMFGLNQAASLLQVVLLTFMVCYRVKIDYSNRLSAEFAARAEQSRAIEQEQAQAQQLAKAVEEKTAALQAALCEVSKLNMELSKQTITDSLTGLFNRRHFDHLLDSEVRRAAREHRPISLVLIDIDHFKKINDTYGHPVGDDCLIQLARLLRQVVRQPPDIVFRFGGEEMALLLPGSDAAGAQVVAEKICSLVAASEFCYPAGCLQLTLSLGVGSLIPSQNTQPREVFELADEALYLAKNRGRNRVACLTHSDRIAAN